MTRWNEFYVTDTRIPSVPPSQLALRAAQIFSDCGCRRILELGCGAGRDLKPLLKAGMDVVGLDISAPGIDLARSLRWEERFPALVRGDARLLPFAPSSFDGVYSFGLLHELTTAMRLHDVERCMGEIRTALRRSGYLVLSVLAGNPEDGLPHVQLFSKEMLTNATRGFSCLSLDQYSDIGCTGSNNYRIWAGVYRKEE